MIFCYSFPSSWYCCPVIRMKLQQMRATKAYACSLEGLFPQLSELHDEGSYFAFAHPSQAQYHQYIETIQTMNHQARLSLLYSRMNLRSTSCLETRDIRLTKRSLSANCIASLGTRSSWLINAKVTTAEIKLIVVPATSRVGSMLDSLMMLLDHLVCSC